MAVKRSGKKRRIPVGRLGIPVLSICVTASGKMFLHEPLGSPWSPGFLREVAALVEDVASGRDERGGEGKGQVVSLSTTRNRKARG